MLIPALIEECGPLSAKEKRFIAICELMQLEAFMEPFAWCGNGRKPLPRLHMARAFLAKALWNLPTTRAIIDRLVADPSLRRLCGWENGPSEIPDEATFSRAFAHFSKIGFGVAVHKHLVVDHLGEETIWYCSTDATAIDAREKPHREPAAEPVAENLLAPLQTAPAQAPAAIASAEKVAPFKRKRGRPAKGQAAPEPEPTRLERHLVGSLAANLIDMPPVLCGHGCKKNAKGHTDHWIGYKLHLSTGNGGVPLVAILSSPMMHDSQPAIILQQSVGERCGAILYDIKDSAYDAAAIKAHSIAQGSIPIIDANRRRSASAPPKEPDRARIYKERTSAERTNSHLKDNHGGDTVRVKGGAKVMTHLMFGILVMTAEALIRLL